MEDCLWLVGGFFVLDRDWEWEWDFDIDLDLDFDFEFGFVPLPGALLIDNLFFLFFSSFYVVKFEFINTFYIFFKIIRQMFSIVLSIKPILFT